MSYICRYCGTTEEDDLVICPCQEQRDRATEEWLREEEQWLDMMRIEMLLQNKKVGNKPQSKRIDPRELRNESEFLTNRIGD
jgi:hypothetical protein